MKLFLELALRAAEEWPCLAEEPLAGGRVGPHEIEQELRDLLLAARAHVTLHPFAAGQ